MTNSTPKPLSNITRLLLAGCAILFIILTLNIMSRLTTPSLYITAVKIVKSGPKTSNSIKTPAFLNFKNYLYLVGPVVSAISEQESGQLFALKTHPALGPSIFADQSGAVEILSDNLPLTAEAADTYQYRQPYHLLGWRTGTAGFSLFAIGKSQESLMSLLKNKAGQWKITLFIYGLILAILVFFIFWLLNMSLLSTPFLETIQFLIINVVFLVLFYSILFLNGYPLVSTIFSTVGILVIANLLFIPLAFIIRRKNWLT